MYKRNINAESIDKSKHSLFEVNWDEVELNLNPNKARQLFLQKSLPFLLKSFPVKKREKIC